MRKPTPFTISPSPKFLYVTPSIESTMNKIRHVVDYGQGLTSIMGDIGLGKSTLVRFLMDEFIEREDIVVAGILSPTYPTDFAFLKAICGEFGLAPKRSLIKQEQELREFLIGLDAEDKTAVLFVDEAQRLKGVQLELIRTLLNFETEQNKLIQIILCGQLELRTKLMDSTKKALRSRILLPSLLAPLSPEETSAMVLFRCQTAGIECPFGEEALREIYDKSGGVPREVLKICQVMFAEGIKMGVSDIPADWVSPVAGEVTLNG